MILAELVDVSALLKVVWVSLVAGVGVSTAFAVAVFGLSRGNDLRRQRGSTPVAHYALALLGLAVCGFALYEGYLFVVTKG